MLVSDEISVFWRMLQEIINKGLEHLSTLKEIGQIDNKTADHSPSIKNMPSKNESMSSTIASQVAAEDTDYQSLMKDTDGQVLTPKSIECSVGSHDMVTQSDNDGFAFKDTYISVSDAGSHCSKTETTDSSSVKDIAIQCFLVKTASPVVVGHNAKYDSIKSTVNASRVKDTVRLDSMKLSTEQVSVTDTVKSYSAKNVVSENAVEEKKPSLELSFSLIH